MIDRGRRLARHHGWPALVAMLLSLQPAYADVLPLEFDSDGVRLPALLHRPDTGPASATVVYLHGNPGSPLEPESRLADALVAEGLALFRFNYRGLWGNPGAFSLANGIEDYRNAMDWLLDGDGLRKHGIDSDRIVLFGYSFGTAVALSGGHDDDRVDAIVALTPCDHGYFGAEFANPDSDIREFLDTATESLFGEGGPVEGGADVFIGDLVGNSAGYRFAPLAASLLDKSLLFLVGVDDEVCYAEDHFFPLYRALAEAGHDGVTAEVFNMDHGMNPVGPEVVFGLAARWISGLD